MYFDSIENCQTAIDVFGSQKAIPMIVRVYFQSERGYSAEQEEYLITAITNTLIETAIIVKQKLENGELIAGDTSEEYGQKLMRPKWDAILRKNAG